MFHAKFDNGQWTSYGSPISTNIWSTGSVPDGTSGECAKVVNDNGEYKIENLEDTIAIIRLVEIKDGITDKQEEAEILKSLEMQIKSTLSQDLFRIMVSEIQKSRGIAIDESAINAVHLNFQ